VLVVGFAAHYRAWAHGLGALLAEPRRTVPGAVVPHIAALSAALVGPVNPHGAWVLRQTRLGADSDPRVLPGCQLLRSEGESPPQIVGQLRRVGFDCVVVHPL
jgi:hypothetical protein